MNICIRLEMGKPIVFTDAPASLGRVECFTWADGHNEASREYMRRLPLAPSDLAEKEAAKYAYYTKTECKLVKRIRK